MISQKEGKTIYQQVMELSFDNPDIILSKKDTIELYHACSKEERSRAVYPNGDTCFVFRAPARDVIIHTKLEDK